MAHGAVERELMPKRPTGAQHETGAGAGMSKSSDESGRAAVLMTIRWPSFRSALNAGFSVALGILLLTPTHFVRDAPSESVTSTQPALTAANTVVGPLRGNVVWDAQGSPYVLTQNVEVTRDATLTVMPGVEVRFDGGSLLPFGPVTFSGTAADPIVVSGAQPFDAMFRETFTSAPRVAMSHVVATGMVNPFDFTSGSAEIDLRDSRLYNPPGTLSEGRLSFAGSVTLNRVEMSRVVVPRGANQITNSLLRGFIDPGGGEALVNVRNGTVVTGSVLDSPGGPSACFCVRPLGDELGVADMRGNYWGATTRESIAADVVDANDSSNFGGIVDFEDWLAAPPQSAMFVPTAPAQPVVRRATPGALEVTWQAPASDGGDSVSRYTIVASPGGAQYTATDTRILITDLTPSTEYTFTVTAVNAAGTSNPSTSSSPIAPAAPLTPPEQVGRPIAEPANGAAIVSWPSPTQGSAEVLEYQVTSSPGGQTLNVVAPATQVRFPGLRNGLAYTFTVTAQNDDGKASASEPSAPVTPAGPPARPANVRATLTQRAVIVRWDDAAANGSSVTSYVVTSSRGLTRTTDSAKNRVAFAKLPSGRHRFFVAAVNALGSSARAASAIVRVPRR